MSEVCKLIRRNHPFERAAVVRGGVELLRTGAVIDIHQHDAPVAARPGDPALDLASKGGGAAAGGHGVHGAEVTEEEHVWIDEHGQAESIEFGHVGAQDEIRARGASAST